MLLGDGGARRPVQVGHRGRQAAVAADRRRGETPHVRPRQDAAPAAGPALALLSSPFMGRWPLVLPIYGEGASCPPHLWGGGLLSSPFIASRPEGPEAQGR